MNETFEKNGFLVLEDVLNFNDFEIEEIERYKKNHKNENFGKNGIVKILSWENTKISNLILNKLRPFKDETKKFSFQRGEKSSGSFIICEMPTEGTNE